MRRFNKILTGIMAVPGLWLAVTGQFVWAMPSARSGGFQPEPSFTVSALRAPAAIAGDNQ